MAGLTAGANLIKTKSSRLVWKIELGAAKQSRESVTFGEFLPDAANIATEASKLYSTKFLLLASDFKRFVKQIRSI